MAIDPSTGSIFSSGGTNPAEVAASVAADMSFQPASRVPGEDKIGDRVAYDMAAAGYVPLGWTRDKRELSFVMQQHSIAEQCRAWRLLGDDHNNQEFSRNLFMVSLRQIGDRTDLGDDFAQQWITDLGMPGFKLLDAAYMRLCTATVAQEAAFKATRQYDPQTRTTSYTIPNRAELAKAQDITDPEKLAKMPGLLPASTEATVERSFALRELNYQTSLHAMEAADDCDNGHEVRILQVMWSIARIGNRTLGTSAEDLAVKRRWLDDIGPKAFLLVRGLYARMHEVERNLLDRFLESAAAPESAG